MLWVGVGLAGAFVITTALNELFVFGPLRRRLRTLRVNLGMAVTDRSAGAMTELEGLLDSIGMLLHLGRGGEEALRDDLLRLRAHNQQLVQVAALGDRLNAALPYRETVEQMLAQVRSFLRADFVALLAAGAESRFRLEGTLGSGSRSLDSTCCDERYDCPLVLASAHDTLLRTSDHRCRFFPHTMTHQITLPLAIADGETRVLLAASTSGEWFDEVWDEALLTLRGHLQQALANARKYDSIRRQVVTDHLTGLYNRRYFINRAAEEIERSLAERTPVTVVMIDIDHFKRFNDTFGHSTGDRVLQTVGSILQQSVRVTDTCARHGGEEFTLLLPNTPGENAVHMANRVRQTLGGTRYTGLGLPKNAAITISCGVATCPQDATSIESLLELADAALYRAKELGRDRVCRHDASTDAPGGVAGEPSGVIQPVEMAPLSMAAGRAVSRRRMRTP